MKKLFTFFFAVLLLTSCASTTKQMTRGNYDWVIEKTTKKLMKKPGDAKSAMEMDRAYRLANERDLERIKYLKMENNPNSSDEIFQRYNSLKMRQQKVRTVTPLEIEGRTYAYDYVDYDTEIVNSKKKAGEFFYNNGKKMLETGITKADYREAYVQLMKAAEYSGAEYGNIDAMIYEARQKGISRVIVEVVNQSQVGLPPQVEEDLISFDTQGLDNNNWTEYHFKHLNDQIKYDYAVLVKLLTIAVSPDDVKDVDQLFTKKIEDGFDYVLDAKGNVMKDTAGNDIKIPRYKEITCTLIETKQLKTVQIKGEVEIIELFPQEKLLQKTPFGAENRFEHQSARAIGDVNALDAASLQKTKQEKLPFPTDVEMVMMCTETIKPAIRNAIYNNRQYIK